ncbi:hypothetical protein [Subtercola boreus]|uniref:hypothetical protein n=1 Tax=Subtercola boreus TaxID=120213 RepID=UPI0015586A6F|nr:hypothetical protein [Subtercola boreus]
MTRAPSPNGVPGLAFAVDAVHAVAGRAPGCAAFAERETPASGVDRAGGET